ncbi:MAG: hypothetical protein ACKOW8_00280, partial [Flavobacteriales bacterium]
MSDAEITDLTGIEAFTSLGQLNCSFNQLTSLNLSALQNLSQLLCNNNQLTALDLSSNQLLELIECSNNQINALDLSQNPFINWVICNNNNLQSLNVRNGNNVNFFNFSAVGNPNLSCIQVDNIDYASSANDWSKDESAFYSENCNCVQGETNYVVGLFDAAENGWDGANLVIYDLFNFNELANVSLATGGVGFVDVCLGAQCFGITAGGGEGDEEISWSIAGGNDFQLSGVANFPEVQTFSPGGTVGCIDPVACNFDSLAVCDDGSCSYPGCRDSSACNFDGNALCADQTLCSNDLLQFDFFLSTNTSGVFNLFQVDIFENSESGKVAGTGLHLRPIIAALADNDPVAALPRPDAADRGAHRIRRCDAPALA